MRKIIFIFIILFLASCSTDDPNIPIKVSGEIEFGHYALTPPLGYWYFQRDYPEKFENPDTLFLLTFFKNKDTFEDRDALKNNHLKIKETLFNVEVSPNNFNNYEDVYAAAKKQGVINKDLSSPFSELATYNEWSCKQTPLNGMYCINCISLRDQLIAIAAIGENENQVVQDIDKFKKIVTSFKITK